MNEAQVTEYITEDNVKILVTDKTIQVVFPRPRGSIKGMIIRWGGKFFQRFFNEVPIKEMKSINYENGHITLIKGRGHSQTTLSFSMSETEATKLINHLKKLSSRLTKEF